MPNNASKKEPEISPKITEVAMSAYSTEHEIKYTNHVLNKLRNVSWVKTLIAQIETNGDIENTANIPLLFEARYAYALHCRKIQAQYEYKTGIGDSSVDFRCKVKQQEWFIELVSILPSKAGKQAIYEFNPKGETSLDGVGVAYEQTLATDAENQNMSEEREIFLALHKIGGKVFAGNHAIKFPIPSNTFHVIVADMRGMLGMGGAGAQDHYDYLEIAYGSKQLAQRNLPFHRLPPPNGKPIVGLFEKNNPLCAAKYIQERIHFIDFVCENKYEDEEIPKRIVWAANPFLFMNDKIKAEKVRINHPLYYSRPADKPDRL